MSEKICALLLSLLLASPLLAADWNQAAFDASDVAGAIKALQMGPSSASRELQIKGLDDAENGALVPVEVSAPAAANFTTGAIAILAENNNFPLAAYFEFSNGALPEVSLRLKLAETTQVRALARSGGKILSAQKEIRVNVGGCGSSSEAPRKSARVTTPMKIQAQMKGDVAEIRVLMTHPMTTPYPGSDIPPHFIRSFSVLLNGKPVVEAQTGFSVARNPVFGFKVRGARSGDKISITWNDSRGDSRTDETSIQ